MYRMLRVLFETMRHRSAEARRFLQMGYGIEQRTRGLKTYWQPHFEESRRIQREWFRPGSQLTVLGAGRLNDFALDDALREFDHLHFVDADPLAAKTWAKISRSTGEIREISGALKPWLEHLAGREWGATLQCLRRIADEIPAETYYPEGDAVLSLGIVSQIPIAWQEAVEDLLQRQFTPQWTKRHEKEWLTAIEPSARYLIEEHVRSLGRNGAQRILIIGDLDYIYYRGPITYRRRNWEPPPIQFVDGTATSARPEPLEFEVCSALYDLEPGDPPGYRRLPMGTWLWHISPLGIENIREGIIHRVGAVAFEKI
jgi:hypothetical protein